MKAYEPTGLTQMIDTANKSQNTAAHGPAKTDDAETIDFGFRQVRRADKQGLVRGVFDSVAERYDVMNDLMSGGVHRLWKAALIDWMAPQPHQHLVDLAGGTGDVSLRFLRAGGGSAVITDINHAMLSAGRRRRDIAKFNDRTSWCVGNAETLPFASATADFVTIAFGLRNVTDRQSAISEAHRVLKPGGRFLCLEFSQVKNDLLARAYDEWSFNALPAIGRLVAGDGESYRYLAESIRTFPTPEVLADMFAGAGFAQVRVRSLSAGVACIHSGWKLD
jgi:demethylmenaquinone methyltransferase/2-methoxy-6-polyprenyl-1,4-benzoquinol methylase